ncbi:MAG: DNA glycosylase AlkZ-like family protein, partial [Acidimicrobiales bacterium]
MGAGEPGSSRLTALRCQAQLLSGPAATDPVDVAGRLLAVQAQDPRGFRLAVRSRTTGVAVDDLERALSIDRSLVVTTLNRGTLHLVRAEDYWWLHALTTPPLFTSSRRRLTETGLDPRQVEVGVEVVTRTLDREGPLTRDELRDHLDGAGVPTAGQALVHLLTITALRGFTVRGPMRDGRQAWVLVADWLGAAPAVDRGAALEALARRYR